MSLISIVYVAVMLCTPFIQSRAVPEFKPEIKREDVPRSNGMSKFDFLYVILRLLCRQENRFHFAV